MPGKSHKTTEAANGACLNDDLLYRYLEKMATQEEAERIEQHLNECNNCFADVTALTEIIRMPITEAERIEINRSRQTSPEEQVEKIIGYLKAESSLTEKAQTPFSETNLQSAKIVALWQIAINFLAWRRAVPRYAFALVAIGVLAILLPYKIFLNQDAGNDYVYDEQSPYDYNMSSLRGAQNGAEADSLLQALVDQFKLAMADYLSRDYAGAVSTLQDLEPAALSLQQMPGEKFVPWLRDYYFYSGVSHFALSRSRVSDLSAEVKQQHAAASIRWLAIADSLVTADRLEGSDRESYFLGLAYGFGGREAAAVAELGKIKSESRFYNDSVKLINQWYKQ